MFVDDYAWKDRFTVTNNGAGTITAALDVHDTVSFELQVGHEYEFVPSISATASLRSPRNVTAIVDFYDTAAALALNPVDAGVQIVVIPEPASASLFCMIALLILSRRRRSA